VRTGYMQFAPSLGDRQRTMETIDRLISLSDSADILVLPELCNSGYNFESMQQAWECSEAVNDSVFLRFLQQGCADRSMHIVSGFCEREGNRLYNSAVLVGPTGVIGVYRKLHLFYKEKEIFAPGDRGLPVFDVAGARVGILICFDWMFPEVWRILALRGADVICHPSNLVLPGMAQRGVPTHALMNRVFTVTANRVGTEGDLTFTGMSIICDPSGQVLIRASETQETVTVVDIDICAARNKMITPKNHLFDDRRPDLYAPLCSEDIK
jgi:predicted amidohydrolase